MLNIASSHQPVHVLIDQNFDDVDALNEASRGWNFDLRQLSHGPSNLHLMQLRSESTLLLKTSYDQKVHQRGATPPDMTTFGFIGMHVPDVEFCGLKANGSTVECFEQSGSYESISPPGFDAFGVSITTSRLQELGEILELRHLEKFLDGQARVFDVAASANNAVWTLSRKIADNTVRNRNGALDSLLSKQMNDELPLLVLATLSRGTNTFDSSSISARNAVRKRTLEYMDHHAKDNPSISEICKQLGCSWRLLDYAFADYFGVTPKAYLKLMRLDGLRRSLRKADANSTITDAALNWGFTHFGKLAKDYRLRFGELPSETLKH
jgi:AraC family ethanolamine operon transcriptional activator